MQFPDRVPLELHSTQALRQSLREDARGPYESTRAQQPQEYRHYQKGMQRDHRSPHLHWIAPDVSVFLAASRTHACGDARDLHINWWQYDTAMPRDVGVHTKHPRRQKRVQRPPESHHRHLPGYSVNGMHKSKSGCEIAHTIRPESPRLIAHLCCLDVSIYLLASKSILSNGVSIFISGSDSSPLQYNRNSG